MLTLVIHGKESMERIEKSLIGTDIEINDREGMQTGAPLMADYDIRENFVIRTDYDGVVINL